MLAALKLDCEREANRIIDFIREQLAQAGYSRLVLGMSGGVDSALVAALCVRAAGPENVKAMILPYHTSNPDSEAHGRLMASTLGMPVERFEITGMVKPLLDRCPDIDARRMGNIMSRCRMITLYDESERFGGLVAGTSNRTESLLGYFTMYGDSASAVKPIAHLYKCQVRDLSRYLGVPDVIVDKAPSADLWEGQTDEDELGFSYDEADQILYLLTEAGLDAEGVAAHGFDLEVVQAVERKMRTMAFKLRPPAALSGYEG
jgi:NAD+ synthase